MPTKEKNLQNSTKQRKKIFQDLFHGGHQQPDSTHASNLVECPNTSHNN